MKISVIIPVYKVEKYLCQCVDSVLTQSYRNLEVILVDDGSPDSCPQICDEYALKDQRVIVIHKKNGGLSDARNSGISKATGEYGVFIDSDDYWTEKNAIECLVNRLRQTKADVINYAYYKLDELSGQRTDFTTLTIDMPFDKKNKYEQLKFLFDHQLVSASACNKMIRMTLLKELPFEVGRLSEDIEWTAKLIGKSSSFDYSAICFYCYRQRHGSISQSISTKTCTDLKKAVIGCCRITNEVAENYREFLQKYTAYQFATFIAVQALAESFQKHSIHELVKYKEALKHFGNSRKVKYMWFGVRIFGLELWCKLIRITVPIWNSRRSRI